MPTAHATLAPSGSARWMKCHPSALVSSQIPQKDTIFTREGTIAHAMAECLLLTALEQNWDEWREDYVDKFRVAYDAATDGKGGRIAGEQSEALRLRIQEAKRMFSARFKTSTRPGSEYSMFRFVRSLRRIRLR